MPLPGSPRIATFTGFPRLEEGFMDLNRLSFCRNAREFFRAILTSQRVHALRFELISRTCYSRARRCGPNATVRRRRKARQLALIVREGIGVRLQVTTPEEFRDTFGQSRGQSRDFFIIRETSSRLLRRLHRARR